MVLKKLLQLFGVGKKKDDKKKGNSIDPLSQGVAPHSTLNILANNNHFVPCSSGAGTALSLQNHELECSSNISSMIKEVHGSEIEDYKSFNQFDVAQDYSDHHYAKTSPGKTTKDWAKTIQNEWKLLQSDLPESIYVRVYEDRIDLLRAAIVGPAGTPYHDGLFFFDVRFPPEYPRCPPHFETIIVRHFHERERAILEACGAYASGMIVGSSVRDGRTYARNKFFARFKKSLDAQTELLTKELAANTIRALELKRDGPSTDGIVATS